MGRLLNSKTVMLVILAVVLLNFNSLPQSSILKKKDKAPVVNNTGSQNTKKVSETNILKPFNKKVKCITSDFNAPIISSTVTSNSDATKKDEGPDYGCTYSQPCSDFLQKGKKEIVCNGYLFSFTYTDEIGVYKINGELYPKGDMIKVVTMSYKGNPNNIAYDFSVTMTDIPKSKSSSNCYFRLAPGMDTNDHIRDVYYTRVEKFMETTKTSHFVRKTNIERQTCQVTFDFE